jgi:hypothetical protein
MGLSLVRASMAAHAPARESAQAATGGQPKMPTRCRTLTYTGFEEVERKRKRLKRS